MKERLIEFMKAEGLTAGRLASMLDVQPSAISHLLGGRNKPGFDFLTALFARFPKLNPRWFILGEGDMYSSVLRKMDVGISDRINETGPEAIFDMAPENNLAKDTQSSFPDILSAIRETSETTRSVEQIVLLYSDNTFTVYSK